jgi:hypothetical protein
MNDDVPPLFALLIGAMIGLLLYGPVKRWIVTLRRTLRERARNKDSQRAGSTKLLVIFATMHPAPWLIVIGLPYGIYRLWSDPLRLTWGCLLAGSILGALLMVAYEALCRARARQTLK